jgi:membrane peptidoglycan carboxypeptidase
VDARRGESGAGRARRPGRPPAEAVASADRDRQRYGDGAAPGYRSPPGPPERQGQSLRNGSGRGSHGRGTHSRDARAVQEPRGAAGRRDGGGPRYQDDPQGGDGMVAQDLRNRLGMRAKQDPRAQQAPRPPADPRAGRDPRLAAAGVAVGAGRRAADRRDGRDSGDAGYGDAGYGDARGYGAGGYGGDARGYRGGGGGGYGGGGGNGRGPGNRAGGFKGWLLYGSWWRHWTWKKAIAIVAAGFAAIMLLVVIAGLYAYSSTRVPTEASELALQQSSSVYFSDNTTRVGTFSANGITRQLLTSQQIPADLTQAVIAAEDRHFYTEGGVSPTGIVRAAYEDVSGGTFQGGSTITQQFVRNYYANIGTAQTASRKIKEILVAVKLSHEKSKDWILTNYLNTVFLGDDSYGVGAAAQTYFGRQAKDLTVAQSAMLAAMINQPGYFNPDPAAGAPYQALYQRWQYVLTNMARDGAITQQQASAQHFPKIVTGQANGYSGYRGYIMEAVQNELMNTYHYTRPQIDSLGLRIDTTFSAKMMSTMNATVKEAKQEMAAEGRALPSWAHVGVVLEKPGSGAILAMYGGPGTSVRHCVKLKCQLNMALQSRNQVGSSFKPYVLAAAVQQGMNAQTSVLDGYQSICSPSDSFPKMPSINVGGTTCPPSSFGYFNFNSFGESNGPVSVAKASALSLNTAYGDLIHRVGTQSVIDIAKRFGVNTGKYPNGSNLQADLGDSTIALGQASLTVEEQATTFATLADGGVYYTPHVIRRITLGNRSIPLKIEHHRVLTEAQAADVDYALSFDTIYGTAVPNAQLTPFRPTIAKTGTTDNAQDAFFIGAIPQYSLAVGMFTNDQQQLPNPVQTLNVLPADHQSTGGYGGAWPATIWNLYMTNEFSHLQVEPLLTPDFTGFTKWIQAKRPHKPKPNPNPTCGPMGRHGHGFGAPCPNPTPSSPSCLPVPVPGCSVPTPTPTPMPPNPTPTPSPSCTPSFGNVCPPTPGPGPGGQQAVRQGVQPAAPSAAAAQAGDDPAATLVRLRPPGG